MHVNIGGMPRHDFTELSWQLREDIEKLTGQNGTSFSFFDPAPEDETELKPLHIRVGQPVSAHIELAVVDLVAWRCLEYCRAHNPPIQFGGFEIGHLRVAQPHRARCASGAQPVEN